MFTELRQRIRYVTQGPDGLLYMLTDHSDGVLLKIAPGSGTADALELQHQEMTEQGISQPEIFTASDCMVCHRVNESLVGPSFVQIAARYPATDENIALLIESILSGVDGNWGDVAMAPHPNLTADTARNMVEQILGLNSQ